jgi:hypothetical protein
VRDPYKGVTFVSSCKDIPAVEHYAIITNTSASDGWGGRQSMVEYKCYLKREDWEEEIQYMAARGDVFRALKVTPATITTRVEVAVDKKPLT